VKRHSLLRRHVGDGTYHTGIGTPVSAGVLDFGGEPEVQQHHPLVPRHEDVGRLHIAMHHSGSM
jgi:hypothetical protein